MTDRVDEARVESVAKEHGAADAGIPAVSPTTIGISGIRSIPRWNGSPWNQPERLAPTWRESISCLTRRGIPMSSWRLTRFLAGER